MPRYRKDGDLLKRPVALKSKSGMCFTEHTRKNSSSGPAEEYIYLILEDSLNPAD